MKKLAVWMLAGWLGMAAVASAEPLQTSFVYQGQLKQGGVPVHDTVDLRVQLLGDAAGTILVGNEIQLDAVEVVNGLFTVELDFGADAFDRDARWLQVSVRAPHDPSNTGAFTTLSPNTPISPTPYALQTRGIFVSETGSVGVGTGPFVADADLQVGVDPVTNTVFGGSTIQVGDPSNAQLILGRPGADYMQMVASSFGSRLGAVGPQGLELRTGATTVDAQSRLFISPTGNVGIGTNTPTAKLEIAPPTSGSALKISGILEANAQTTTGASRAWVGIGGNSPVFGNESLAIRYSTNNDTQNFGGMVLAAESANGLPYYGYATIGKSAWSYLNGFDGTWRLHVGNFDPVTVTEDGKIGLGGLFPNPVNTLSVFGTADVQGNLGVGTTAPTNRLSVSGSANISGSLGIGTTTPGSTLHVFRGDSGNAIAATRSLVLEDDATHYMQVLAPDAFESGILFGNPTNGSTAAGVIFNSPNNLNGLQLRTGTNDTQMVIDSSGLVGIGASAPERKLHVTGGSDISTGGAGGFAMFGASTGANLLLDENEIQAVNNGAVNSLGINALGGSVGIGTPSPQSLLHVFKADAGMASSASNTLLTLESDATHYLRMMVPDAAETGVTFGNPTNGLSAASVIFGGATPNGLQFRTGTNDPHMVLDSSGRWGLGTTAPATKAEIVANGAALRLTSANTSLPRLELKSGTSTFPEAGGIRFIDMNDEIEWSLHMDSGADFAIGVGTRDIMTISSGFPDRVDMGNDVVLDVQASNPDFDGVISLTRQIPGRLVRFSDADNTNPAIISEIGNITYSGTTVSYNAFTGSHYAWSAETFEDGMLISMTGKNRRTHSDEDGEPIYGAAKTGKPNDPAVLGAYFQKLDLGEATDTHLVSSVGNGELCVVDRGGGDIVPGDSLISSDVAGCAMKDDPARFAVGHVIAKAADRIVWSEVQPDETGVRRKTASVLFGAFERVGSDKTVAEVERIRGELERKSAELEEVKTRLLRLEAMLSHTSSAKP